MEELLNKLIKRWWKPFWWDDKLSSLHKEYGVWKWYIRFHNWMDSESFDLRQLTSKESWLRQFCIKNKLLKEDDGHITRIISEYKDNKWIIDSWWDYHYWLMICSILDESELEDFLLENIKVEWK